MHAVFETAELAGSTEQTQGPGKATGILLLLMSCLAVMGAVLLAPIIPLMVQHFAAVPGAAVLVPVALVIPGLCMALTSPIAGMLVDAIGRKTVLLWAFVIYAFAGIAPFWLDSLHLIIASRVVVGIAEAAIMTASTTLITDFYSGEQRQTWLAWQTGVASLSAVVLIAVGGMLGAAGWRVPFLVYGLAILFVPASLVLLPAPPPVPRVPGGGVHPLAAMQPILGLCGLSVIAGICFYAVPIQVGSVLTARGVSSTTTIGLAAAAGSAAVPVGSWVFGRIASWPFRRRLVSSFLLMAAGFLIIAQAHELWGTLLGVVVASLGAGIVLPVLLTETASRLAPALRGQGVGAWMASFFLGQFCSPLVVAGINLATGSLGATFAVLAAMAAVLALGYMAIRNT